MEVKVEVNTWAAGETGDCRDAIGHVVEPISHRSIQEMSCTALG